MRAPEQEPVESEDTLGGKKFDHPAFASISASRISGQQVLYGSDFLHQHYMAVRIAPSTTTRRHSENNHYSPNVPYIEVFMSEAQWATFVSSVSVGRGTPCTLRAMKGMGQIPELPAPKDQTQDFTAEVKAKVTKAMDGLVSLEKRIAEAKMSEKERKALLGHVAMAKQELVSNIPFVAKQFGEYMEKTVEKAKVEVNAYANATVRELGIRALQEQAPIALLPKTDGPDTPEVEVVDE